MRRKGLLDHEHFSNKDRGKNRKFDTDKKKQIVKAKRKELKEKRRKRQDAQTFASIDLPPAKADQIENDLDESANDPAEPNDA